MVKSKKSVKLIKLTLREVVTATSFMLKVLGEAAGVACEYWIPQYPAIEIIELTLFH